ncbi:MarR family winged helix-turn-helix transcriptional regulator [Microbacterium xanthum]|uniref:MarR family winged helix-turn-helix transcriptional regulator n=1 Tax=Microbacterium xanthum TaxID=3079794 RepID=UPI002AD3ABA2|nr:MULTISPECIES: MarR family transcriptional regulator [unclassified Microbacterium]MDZ8172570.1 MarR family transcriptional regulator [Microbacterium sp. KSW-48]MDZ8202593.1 MarR family transcriptional regulator [Microbacterium sp. SSW1-59]
MAGVDDMVCFSLYAASRSTTQAYRRVLRPWDLTYPQYLVLVALWTEGPLSVRRIGDRLALDSGTLSPLLRRLERRGYVTRGRRSDDERVVDVSLTEAGEALRDEMHEVPRQIAECMGIGIDAARALMDSLHELTARVQAGNEATAS